MNQRPGELVAIAELRSEDAARIVEALARVACEFKSLARTGVNEDTLGGVAKAAALAAVQVGRAAAGVSYADPDVLAAARVGERVAEIAAKVRP